MEDALAQLSRGESHYIVTLESIHSTHVKISLRPLPGKPLQDDLEGLYAVAAFVESCFRAQLPDIDVVANRKCKKNYFRFTLYGDIDYGPDTVEYFRAFFVTAHSVYSVHGMR